MKIKYYQIGAAIALLITLLAIWALGKTNEWTIRQAAAAEDPEITQVIFKLINCESSYIPDQNVIDSNGKMAFGLLQFQLDSFNWFGEKYGLPHDDIEDPEQQIAIARQVIGHGLGKATWKNCYRKLKL